MSKVVSDKKVACFHCGEDCPDLGYKIDDKYFCCNGCKFVYEILSQNNLDNYYDQEKVPGLKIGSNLDKKFAYLDNDEIIKKVIDFTDGDTTRITLHLPQIHCSACIWLLENLNRLNPGITKSRVDFLKKEVTFILANDKINLRQLVELLTSIGYEPRISLDNIKTVVKDNSRKILYLRVGLAGFAFANIMLFSLPKYLDSHGMISTTLEDFFGILNILLSIPVFFFSAYPYYQSAYQGLKQRYINMDVPITLGIFILFSRSLYEIISGHGIGYMDSFTGLVFFLLIGKIFQQKTYDALSFDRDYTSYFPISITKIEDENEIPTLVQKLEPGDKILVRNQELIPADSILLSESAEIDYSFVTGESETVHVKKGETVYAGGRQSGAVIELEVVKFVSQSYITQLWNEIGGGKTDEESTISSYANYFSKHFTFGVITIALATSAYWIFIDSSHAFNAATAVLIVACPCALALSTPFTLGTAQRILGRNKFFIKHSNVIETLSKIDHIVFDKTGTLTKSKAADISFEGEELDYNDMVLVKSLTRHTTHPLSRKISRSLGDIQISEVVNFSEKTGLGLSGEIDGYKVQLGSAKWLKGEKDKTDPNDYSVRVYLSINDNIKGYFKITSEYRSGLADIFAHVKDKATFSVLSGDNEFEKPRLEQMFTPQTEYHFNQSPKDKLEYIRKLRKSGKKVLMFGDGLNDAGALMEANVGVAVSEDIANFTPASDAILDGAMFEKLSKFLSFSEKAVKIILISFVISILYNIIGLSFAVQAKLSPLIAAILMPISSISVVIFTSVTTRLIGKRTGL